MRTFSISTGLVASTVTPGSTAPVVSRTRPVMALCADAKVGTRNNPRKIDPRRTRLHWEARMISPDWDESRWDSRESERTLAVPVKHGQSQTGGLQQEVRAVLRQYSDGRANHHQTTASRAERNIRPSDDV